GDVDALDAEVAHQPRPAFAGGRLGGAEAEVAVGVRERLLDEPGDRAGVGAAGGARGWAARILPLRGEEGLAERVVRTAAGVAAGLEIEAPPGLDDGVHTERGALQ